MGGGSNAERNREREKKKHLEKKNDALEWHDRLPDIQKSG